MWEGGGGGGGGGQSLLPNTPASPKLFLRTHVINKYNDNKVKGIKQFRTFQCSTFISNSVWLKASGPSIQICMAWSTAQHVTH